ncbi:MAG: bifunctional oligoribonuclease/PAP phosphatase NrnA [Lachnospiraceae bacterium]
MNPLITLIEESNSIAITGHNRPDGDCVGSTLGLYNYIIDNYPDKQVTVYLEPFKEPFSFLRGSQQVVHETTAKIYDLMVVLDCSNIERCSTFAVLHQNAKKTICIDHHISNMTFCDYEVVEPEISSASELVYSLLNPEQVSKETAEALYMGIVHDTGVFKYSCTSPKTMQTAGALIAKGIDTAYIIDETFYRKTYVQNQILGRTLLESILFLEKKCIFSSIRYKYFDFYGVTSKDLDGIIDQLRVTKGVEVALLVIEIEPGVHKVSLRSNGKVDVNEVASHFGGGGHILASGCVIHGNIHDVINNLSLHIERQLKEQGIV